ncbi:MAG: hypothetical protein ISN64_03205 [Rickettsia sp.]|nr:hypothetical protein [Rickettsia sp.]
MENLTLEIHTYGGGEILERVFNGISLALKFAPAIFKGNIQFQHTSVNGFGNLPTHFVVAKIGVGMKTIMSKNFFIKQIPQFL